LSAHRGRGGVNISPVRIHETAPETGPGLVALGFDPGITTPGITLVERRGRGFRPVFHKVLRSDAADSDTDRYNAITDLISWAIREFHPAIFVSEEQRNTQSAKQMDGEKRFNSNNSKTIITVGLGCAVARLHRVPWIEVRTQTARASLIGKMSGSKAEKKKRVKAFVDVLLGTDLPMDAAEAGLNAIYGLSVNGKEISSSAPARRPGAARRTHR